MTLPTPLPPEEVNREAIVDFLAAVPEFKEVPRDQLTWLVRESSVVFALPGNLFVPGEMIRALMIILDGELQAYSIQNGQKKMQMSASPGGITGLIPFSRMKTAPIYGEITKRTTALMLEEAKFPELAKNYELTGVFVHALVDRARHFTTIHFQNEKLMALGKLSAGLAHELNNPAAAILRNAEDLKHTIGTLPDTIKTIASLGLGPTELSQLAPIFSKVTTASTGSLSSIERLNREDEMLDWLGAHGLEDDCVSPLLDAGLTISDLESIYAITKTQAFPGFIKWLSEELQTLKTADEISLASQRISELVQSVKNYTRMDQVHDMQEVCINNGISNTLTILQHKIQRNGVTVTEQLEDNLPQISGFPGELNQVWTNIIDNALDAMKKGGDLSVKTFSAADSVTFEVTDSGSGISPENLERIFDPFFTTKDVGEGTGVGLDVVQKVVQLHHGSINVDSRPGRTEFRITFPRMSR